VKKKLPKDVPGLVHLLCAWVAEHLEGSIKGRVQGPTGRRRLG
jgi:hypothetical protein